MTGVRGAAYWIWRRETIDTDLRAQKYSNKFYKNSARLSGVIETPPNSKRNIKIGLQAAWETKYSGDNAFKVAVWSQEV